MWVPVVYDGPLNLVSKEVVIYEDVEKGIRKTRTDFLLPKEIIDLSKGNELVSGNDKSVVFVCNSYKHSQDRFFDFLSQLPFYMSPGIKIKPHKIEFDNGCKITFCRDLKNHRSGIDFLIIDHAGFMDLKSVLGDVIPYLSSKQHTQCFIASTPNKNSEFNKLFETSKWNKIILNWDIVPDRDSYWVQQMTNLLGGFQFFLNEYHVDDSVSSTRDLIIDSLISCK